MKMKRPKRVRSRRRAAAAAVSPKHCPCLAGSFLLAWAFLPFFYYHYHGPAAVPGGDAFANFYSSGSAAAGGANSDHPCKYDGNCPVGEVCDRSRGTCGSVLGDADAGRFASSDRSRLASCAAACSAELGADEWYLHESVPSVLSSRASKMGGCVLLYRRRKKTDPSGGRKHEPVTAEEWMQGRFRRVVRVDPNPGSSDPPSPSWMAYCRDPCESDRDCPGGIAGSFECSGRAERTVPWPRITSSPKSCRQRRPQTAELEGPMGSRDMYVVTGANSGYFGGLKNLAASLRYWSPERKLVVYNLGMTSRQVEDVRSWPNVHRLHWPDGIPGHYPRHVRENLKNYAWKPIVINETVHRYGSIFWLDAGATFVGPVEPIEEILHRHGLFLVRGQDLGMERLSHPGTYASLGYDKGSFRGGPHYAGNTQGHVYPSRYIDSIVVPNAKCALDESCIAPEGSSLRNHRYDQTSLSILAYSDRVRAPHYTEFLAAGREQLHRNMSQPSSQYIIWTARASCSYYSDLGVLKGKE